MSSRNMTQYRPAVLKSGQLTPAESEQSRKERLQKLYDRWKQFSAEYEVAHNARDQEVLTNLRGLMLLIKKEILRLGGEVPTFPAHGEFFLADL